jgi:D-alanyl-lipoteichoic acid acyltransferase DltB (MBOAT superfamily)
MLFNSIQFVIFFPTVVLLYFALPFSLRWILLLIASCYFYMAWRAIYIVLLLFTCVTDYAAAIMMERAKTIAYKRLALCLSLGTNLGVLFFFKYYNFFTDTTNEALKNLSLSSTIPTLNLILPVGISFYTFQAMSYTIDVYRGELKAERSFPRFVLFVMFFPQLVAGPIERATKLMPQLRERFNFDYQRVVDGLRLMAVGFFKKVVIADNLAILVNQVYGAPQNYSSLALVAATFCFTYQVFCDFSGYSDIAIGASRVFGIELMKNFERPFFARNLSEFWRRCHISLSTWFRDYVYIPLGGNHLGTPRTVFNIFVVFMLSGIWHGAAWTFVIWGLIQGFYFLFGKYTAPLRTKFVTFVGLNRTPGLLRVLQSLKVFWLYAFSLIFFRAQSFSDAWYIVTHLGTTLFSDIFSPVEWFKVLHLGPSLAKCTAVLIFIATMEWFHYLQEKRDVWSEFKEMDVNSRWLFYLLFAFAFLLFGEFGGQQFIYFQF